MVIFFFFFFIFYKLITLAKEFISHSKKVLELNKVNEILIMLKNDSDLNNCISRLNLVILELNQKGYKLNSFDKKNLQLNLGIEDTDKAVYKKDDDKLIISLNYSLMNN